MQISYPLVRTSHEKLATRIAVSEDARRTVVEHVGGDAIIIPNGVWVDRFAAAKPVEKWVGTPQAPTIAFLGRLEDRKSTRLNSSHVAISYAVFCLKKK